MPKIFLPTPLRPFADDASTVEAAGATVAEALESLVSQYAGLRAHLFDGSGKLRAFVNVYRNDEDIRHLDRERTALADGDTLSIVPSIAGRRRRRLRLRQSGSTPRRSRRRSSSAMRGI